MTKRVSKKLTICDFRRYYNLSLQLIFARVVLQTKSNVINRNPKLFKSSRIHYKKGIKKQRINWSIIELTSFKPLIFEEPVLLSVSSIEARGIARVSSFKSRFFEFKAKK